MALGDAQQLACLKAEKKKISSGAIIKLKSGIIAKYDNCNKILRKNEDNYQHFSRQFKSHVSHVLNFVEGSLLLLMAKLHAEKE